MLLLVGRNDALSMSPKLAPMDGSCFKLDADANELQPAAPLTTGLPGWIKGVLSKPAVLKLFMDVADCKIALGRELLPFASRKSISERDSVLPQ